MDFFILFAALILIKFKSSNFFGLEEFLSNSIVITEKDLSKNKYSNGTSLYVIWIFSDTTSKIVPCVLGFDLFSFMKIL